MKILFKAFRPLTKLCNLLLWTLGEQDIGEEAKTGRASELAVDKKTKNQLKTLSYI